MRKVVSGLSLVSLFLTGSLSFAFAPDFEAPVDSSFMVKICNHLSGFQFSAMPSDYTSMTAEQACLQESKKKSAVSSMRKVLIAWVRDCSSAKKAPASACNNDFNKGMGYTEAAAEFAAFPGCGKLSQSATGLIPTDPSAKTTN